MKAVFVLLGFALSLGAVSVPFDAVPARVGPIAVAAFADTASVTWPDGKGRPCTAVFSLDPAKPLIVSISINGAQVVGRAQPVYRASTGKRRGGFDQFFDFPPSHPDGTRSFLGDFKLSGGRAKYDGDRLDMAFDGFKLGIFQGSIHYIFYPGSNLIQQRALVSTSEPDTAYFYDAGLRMAVDEDAAYFGCSGASLTGAFLEGFVRSPSPA